MKQLVQQLGDGKIQVLEFPPPAVLPGMIQVANYYSAISPGTEGNTIRAARQTLIGKAKSKPEHLKKVWESLQRQGWKQTYALVKDRLSAYSPLGYSSVGKVVAVGKGVKNFQVGDHVACAGTGYASHAEVICVPELLAVKITHENWQGAALNTLGAIALQGVRQATGQLGETVVVIGLGILGQLTCRLLEVSGIQAVGIDLEERRVELAQGKGRVAYLRSFPHLEEEILAISGNKGVDAAIITAATSARDPINLAGRLLRQRGCVVIVGDVSPDFSRKEFYRKEITIKMSCSYGPGRYDPNYEERGQDYPFGWVRWTENRNMQAFQELLAQEKLSVAELVGQVYSLEKVSEIYDSIAQGEAKSLGVVWLIEYAQAPSLKTSIDVPKITTAPYSNIKIGFVGAGKYARSFLLPYLKKSQQPWHPFSWLYSARTAKCQLCLVVNNSGLTARRAAEEFGFASFSSSEEDLWSHPEINTVFVATRHNSHYYYVKKCFELGKHVFVEKPLCLELSQLHELSQLYQKSPSQVMVGFNRRFSVLSNYLKDYLGSEPMNIIYRINAGSLPPTHWLLDPQQGGGRILGEVCHFIDLVSYFTSSLPIEVFAQSYDIAQQTMQAQIKFANGSLAQIAYMSNGSSLLEKEYLEIFQGQKTLVLRDFKEARVYLGNKKQHTKKLPTPDKGQDCMLQYFLLRLNQHENVAWMSFPEIFQVSLATLLLPVSLRENRPIALADYAEGEL